MTTQNERTCIDIFTGVGCFSIAARANGVRTVAMCEIKSDCRNFLREQWPGVEIHDNAKTFDGARHKGVWLVCGGPPCQPASVAGERRGAADHRWLWPEAVRIVRESGPTWFLFENPPGIKSVGLDGVLADLEAAGYEVGTLNIPACAVNSPQRRERLWIVGHAKNDARRVVQREGWSADSNNGGSPEIGVVASPDQERCGRRLQQDGQAQQGRTEVDERMQISSLADSESEQQRSRLRDQQPSRFGRGELADEVSGCNVADAESEHSGRNEQGRGPERRDANRGITPLDLWSESLWIECGDGKRRRSKPGVCGVVNGPSVGLLEALGNAIVWPIAAAVIAAMTKAEELKS